MADAPNVIRVPKPSRKSFQKDRPICNNSLIGNQVRHMHELELQLRQKLDDGIRFDEVNTESEAAQYLKRMTAIFHPHLQHGGH